MKIKFSKSVEYRPEWNGNQELPADEQIVATITPLKVKDLLLIMDALGGAAVAARGAEEIQQHLDTTKFVTACGDLLPRYVQLRGLEGEDGPVSIDQLTDYAYFVPLAAELLMRCAVVSTPSDVAEGNSPAQPV